MYMQVAGWLWWWSGGLYKVQLIVFLEQGSGTHGSRASCGSFDGCIWLSDKSLISIFLELHRAIFFAASLHTYNRLKWRTVLIVSQI